MKSIGIIGIGNMGSAIAKGILSSSLSIDLFLCDMDEKKKTQFPNASFTVHAYELFNTCDLIILAMKPQYFSSFVEDNAHKINHANNPIILSIMAGITTETLRQKLGYEKIVRTMPNLPATVGMSLTGYICSGSVIDEEKTAIKSILTSFGKTIEMKKESDIDAITALSGSGPAYYFYLTEIMSQQAQELGFSESDARLIAETTFTGAAELLRNNLKTAKEWREAVTSPGGTTEAALRDFQKNQLPQIISSGIQKAEERSKELSR